MVPDLGQALSIALRLAKFALVNRGQYSSRYKLIRLRLPDRSSPAISKCGRLSQCRPRLIHTPPATQASGHQWKACDYKSPSIAGINGECSRGHKADTSTRGPVNRQDNLS